MTDFLEKARGYQEEIRVLLQRAEALTETLLGELTAELKPLLQKWGWGYDTFYGEWWIEQPNSLLTQPYEYLYNRQEEREERTKFLQLLRPDIYGCLTERDHENEVSLGCHISIPIEFLPKEDYRWVVKINDQWRLIPYLQGEAFSYGESSQSYGVSFPSEGTVRSWWGVYGPVTESLGKEILPLLQEEEIDPDVYLPYYQKEDESEGRVYFY